MSRNINQYVDTPAWRLMDAFNEVERTQRAIDDSHARIADMRLIWRLSDRNPRSIKELANELALERSTVSRQVSAAHSQGLVERSQAPTDGARTITASQRGLDLLESTVASRIGAYQRCLDAIPVDEQERFLELIALVTAATDVD